MNTRKNEKLDHPREFLKVFRGVVVTDGYEVYHKLARERQDLEDCRLLVTCPTTVFGGCESSRATGSREKDRCVYRTSENRRDLQCG